MRLPRTMRGRGLARRPEPLRFVLFLAVGGTVTLFNLAFVWLLSRQQVLPYIAYVALATECATLASFLLNDRLTFRSMATRGRPWYVRGVRFHGAAAVGAILTVATSAVGHHALHLPPVQAQGAAIGCATGVNFAMHRLWTYRTPREQVRPLVVVTVNAGNGISD